jgi:hypothetical protein
VSVATTPRSPYSVLLRLWFLHAMSASAATSTSTVPPAAAAPVAVTVAVHPVAITIVAAFHPVPVAIVVLSAGECQTSETENQQQTKNYDSL